MKPTATAHQCSENKKFGIFNSKWDVYIQKIETETHEFEFRLNFLGEFIFKRFFCYNKYIQVTGRDLFNIDEALGSTSSTAKKPPLWDKWGKQFCFIFWLIVSVHFYPQCTLEGLVYLLYPRRWNSNKIRMYFLLHFYILFFHLKPWELGIISGKKQRWSSRLLKAPEKASNTFFFISNISKIQHVMMWDSMKTLLSFYYRMNILSYAYFYLYSSLIPKF